MESSDGSGSAFNMVTGLQSKLQGLVSFLFEKGQMLMESLGFTVEELEFFYEYGLGLYNAGKYEEAKQVFFFLEQLNHADFRFPFAYASCSYKLEKYDEAIQYYSLAAFLEGDNPAIWFNLGDCYLQMKAYHPATAMLEQAITKASGNPEFTGIKEDAERLLNVVAHHQAAGSAA